MVGGKLSVRLLGVVSFAIVGSSAYARCSGEMNLDPASPCYNGSPLDPAVTAVRDVQQIIVTGQRMDPMLGSYYWYMEMIDRGLLPSASVAYEVSKTVADAANALSPLLQKCATTTAANAIQTPDQDSGFAWFLARDAVVSAFSGNWGSVSRGQRVDVKYPNGDVVRFFILSVTDSPNIRDRDVGLVRFLSGVPSGEKSPCI